MLNKALKHKWFKKVTYEEFSEDSVFSIKNIVELTGTTRELPEIKKLTLRDMEEIVINNPLLNKIKVMWEVFDQKGDGTISKEEMKEVLHKSDLKISDKDQTKILNEWNYIKDGKINYIEFLSVTVRSREFQLKVI